jgi:hypothetical protein
VSTLLDDHVSDAMATFELAQYPATSVLKQS